MYVCMYVCMYACMYVYVNVVWLYWLLFALVGSAGAWKSWGFGFKFVPPPPAKPPAKKKKTGKQSYYCNTVLSILTSGLDVERKREGRAAASGLESPGLRVSGTGSNSKDDSGLQGETLKGTLGVI